MGVKIKSDKSSTLYQNLVESLPVGVLIIKDELVDYANPHAIRMLGLADNEELLVKPTSFLHPNYNNEFWLLVSNIQKEKNPGFIELKMQQIGGKSVLDVEASGGLLDDGSVQLLIHDVSTRKQLAREQLRAQIAEETNLQLQKTFLHFEIQEYFQFLPF